jgi:hypothetical protein
VKLSLARYSASSSPPPRQWLAKSPGRLLHPHVCQVHALLFVPRISPALPAQHLHGSIAMLPPHASCASPLISFPGSPSWYPCSCTPRARRRRTRKFPVGLLTVSASTKNKPAWRINLDLPGQTAVSRSSTSPTSSSS